ncbi:hypothetical protein PR048_033624 [Dryococelus australis]|uniref:Uncharacterized protein n=1 Tax=Dryococelus australis TaxID=614101 RepID=A0ABQ9G0U0_9NEOP|nr:hypothetical protein PR048_033624 [Dryococelus australis]
MRGMFAVERNGSPRQTCAGARAGQLHSKHHPLNYSARDQLAPSSRRPGPRQSCTTSPRWSEMGGAAPEMKGWGKREIPEETRQASAPSGTTPTCEPGSPRWEASSLTTTPPVLSTQATAYHRDKPTSTRALLNSWGYRFQNVPVIAQASSNETREAGTFYIGPMRLLKPQRTHTTRGVRKQGIRRVSRATSGASVESATASIGTVKSEILRCGTTELDSKLNERGNCTHRLHRTSCMKAVIHDAVARIEITNRRNWRFETDFISISSSALNSNGAKVFFCRSQIRSRIEFLTTLVQPAVRDQTNHNRHDGNTARLARRSDAALGVRVSVARIAPSLLDLCPGSTLIFISNSLLNPRGDSRRHLEMVSTEEKIPPGRRRSDGIESRWPHSTLATSARNSQFSGYPRLQTSADVMDANPHGTIGRGMAEGRQGEGETQLPPPNPRRSIRANSIPQTAPAICKNGTLAYIHRCSLVEWKGQHRGGLVVRLLTSHLCEPGSIPGGVAPVFSMWESWRTTPLVGGFSRGSPVSLALHSAAVPYSRFFALDGCLDLAVKRRPTLSNPTLHQQCNELIHGWFMSLVTLSHDARHFRLRNELASSSPVNEAESFNVNIGTRTYRAVLNSRRPGTAVPPTPIRTRRDVFQPRDHVQLPSPLSSSSPPPRESFGHEEGGRPQNSGPEMDEGLAKHHSRSWAHELFRKFIPSDENAVLAGAPSPLIKNQGPGGVKIRLRASYVGEPSSIPGGFTRGSPVSHCPSTPMLLHNHLASPSSVLKTSNTFPFESPVHCLSTSKLQARFSWNPALIRLGGSFVISDVHGGGTLRDLEREVCEDRGDNESAGRRVAAREKSATASIGIVKGEILRYGTTVLDV